MKSSWTVGVGAVLLFSSLASGDTITFTTGMQVPESITPIPSGFGSLTGFLIPDPTDSNAFPDIGSTIWQVSPSGQLSPFSGSPYSLRDGIFLPNTFGSFGGDYGVAGFLGNGVSGYDLGQTGGSISMYDSTGTLKGSIATPFYPSGLAIAPDPFGTIGGDLLVTYAETGQAGIAVFDSTGKELSDLVTENTFAPFYMAFAPSTFGGFGNDLFFTDDRQPDIWEVGADGQTNLFATIHGASSTRFIDFAPANYGPWAGDMIVGIPGTSLGAEDGLVYVLDSSGNIVATLTGLNPRGFTFTNDGTQMLLNITDPGVQQVAPTDFTPSAVPEPASFVLAGLGLLTAAAIRGRRRNGQKQN